MAKQKDEDAILRSLYGSYYQDTTDSLIRTTKLDRNSVTNGLKSLAKYGYVSQNDLAMYVITRLGIYYLEMNRLVSTTQIEANERAQLALLDALDSGRSTVEIPVDSDVDPHSVSANRLLLVTSRLLEQDKDDAYVLTEDGKNHLRYLHTKYRTPVAPVVPVVKATRKRATVSTVAAAAPQEVSSPE